MRAGDLLYIFYLYLQSKDLALTGFKPPIEVTSIDPSTPEPESHPIF